MAITVRQLIELLGEFGDDLEVMVEAEDEDGELYDTPVLSVDTEGGGSQPLRVVLYAFTSFDAEVEDEVEEEESE